DLQGHPQDLLQLVRRERREITRGQRLELRGRGHADGLVAGVTVTVALPRFQRQRLAAGALAAWRRVLGQGRGGERLGYAIGLGGGAPERVEDPVENREVLGPA